MYLYFSFFFFTLYTMYDMVLYEIFYFVFLNHLYLLIM